MVDFTHITKATSYALGQSVPVNQSWILCVDSPNASTTNRIINKIAQNVVHISLKTQQLGYYHFEEIVTQLAVWLPVHPVKIILRNDIIFISVIYFVQRYGREVYDEHIFHKNHFISVMTMTHSSAIFPVWQYCERTQPIRWLVALEESWNSPQMCILGYNHRQHYIDVKMTTVASRITSLMVVYSIVYSGADKKKTSKLRVTGLCAGIHRDRWIPHTKGQ